MTISKGWKITLGVIGGIVLVLVVVFFVFSPPPTPSCGDNMEFFTHPYIDIEDTDSIMPLGNLAPSGHTFPTKHLYYNLAGFGFEGNVQVSGAPITVYAPGDMTLTGVNSSEYTEEGYTDYSINYEVCDEFTGYFIHLTALSPELEEKLDTPLKFCQESSPGGRNTISCSYGANIEVSGGDIIGKVGREGQGNFDFGARDTRADKPTVANPDRVQNKDATTVCALDYYTPELKEELYGLLGNPGDWRTVEPRCGTPYQDVVGTLQGIWFAKGTGNNDRDEGPHLALVHDNFDPTIGVISMGTSLESLGVSSDRLEFTPEDSGKVNRDFDQTEVGGMYCYDVNGSSDPGNPRPASILIELVDKDNIKVGPADSYPCTSSMSFDGFMEFER